MEKKVTKKNVLNAIAAVVNPDVEVEVDGVVVSGADILDYAEKTIAQIDAKNEKAKVRNAEKKAEGDDLTKAIEAVLSDEHITIADIVAAVDVEGVTPAKVTARLTSLVKNGKVDKIEVKTEDGRKVKAYALAE